MKPLKPNMPAENIGAAISREDSYREDRLDPGPFARAQSPPWGWDETAGLCGDPEL